MTIALSASQAPVSDAEIRRFEETLGTSLPTAYRAFLQKHNGGKPQPKRFITQDGKVKSMIAAFFALIEGGEESLIAEYRGFTAAKQIPRNIISIARDPADNRIVISLDGDDRGSVYYWSWDEEPEPASCSYEYMRLIASDFDDFLRVLT